MNMKVARVNVGRIAERIVMNELESRGYHIIDLAYTSKTFANVDFIASKAGQSFNVQVKGTSLKSGARRAVQYGYCTKEIVAGTVPMFNGKTEAALRADVIVLVGVYSPSKYHAVVLPVATAEQAAQTNIGQYYRGTKRDGGVRKENKVYVELEGSPKPRVPVHPEKIRERAILLAHLDAWDLAAPPQLR
ncbi:hypothetical protein KB221_00630 [Aquidulcibacter paucihalophilus]|nr:hypothetical protein KB221_00630 [Aquidulcibacter paucihalophilus]